MTYQNLDAKLVNELLKDGRNSLRALGEELDVSVTTISNHLSTLEETGAIEGFVPVVNYEEFGYNVTAIIQLKVDGESIVDVADQLRNHDQMISVRETTGDYDIYAVGKFKDTDDLNNNIKTLLNNKAIEDTNTSTVLNETKDHEQFEIPVQEDDHNE